MALREKTRGSGELLSRAGWWLRVVLLLLSCGAMSAYGGTMPSTAPVALPEGDHGIAAKYSGDAGIGGDPAVIFHDDFEAGHPVGRWDMVFQEQNVRLAEEPANVHGGKRAVELVVPKQSAEVSNALVKRLNREHDVLFLRYYSKFSEGFDPIGSSHNGCYVAAAAPEMPYSSPGVRADGRNKFEACFEHWRGDAQTQSPGHLNVYCYHPEQRSEYGDHFFPTGVVLPFTYRKGDFGPGFVSRPDIIPQLGRWYCYEFMVKANTPGQHDGRIACWVDGRLIADFPNLRLRDVETLKFSAASVGLHIKSNTGRENRKWYDDVVIATSYVGPVKKN